MEDFQEEIEIKQDLYFSGVANIKYSSERHDYLTDKTGLAHYTFISFYDIEIHDIKQISEGEYISSDKQLQVLPLSKNPIGHIGEETYELQPTEFFITSKSPVPAHEQIDGDELYGHFENIDVVFKTHRTEKQIVCKQGYATGREIIEDGVTLIEYYNRDCSTNWLRKTDETKKPQCAQGKYTGNTRAIGGVVEREYYNADCTTYWKPYKGEAKDCIQGKWTGKTRLSNGWEQREYTNSDCSTYWQNFRPLSQPPKPAGCLESLWNLVRLIIGSLFALFLLGVIISLKLYYILIPIALLLGAYWLFNYFGQFALVKKIASFILRLLFSILFFLFLLWGLYTLFESFNREHVREERKQQRVERTKTEVEPDIIENLEEGVLEVTINWRDYFDKQYIGKYFLKISEIKQSQQNSQNNSSNYTAYAQVYQNLYANDRNHLHYVYTMLDSIRDSDSMNEIQFAELIISMVQNQTYTVVLHEHCSDPKVLSNIDVKELLEQGFECEGNFKYGIKPPTVFMADLKGDCDTRTLLLYTIFKRFNYDVAIINSEYYAHSMLGLNIPGLRGVYKPYMGRNYYFVETTAQGFRLGHLPANTSNLNFWKVELN